MILEFWTFNETIASYVMVLKMFNLQTSFEST